MRRDRHAGRRHALRRDIALLILLEFQDRPRGEGIDADDRAAPVEQRAARISLIDRCVVLDDRPACAAHRRGRDFADNALGDGRGRLRFVGIEQIVRNAGIADGIDALAAARVIEHRMNGQEERRLVELGYAQDRDIELDRTPHELSEMVLLRARDADDVNHSRFRRLFQRLGEIARIDDMIIRRDVLVRNNEAAADRAALDRLERRLRALDRANHDANGAGVRFRQIERSRRHGRCENQRKNC